MTNAARPVPVTEGERLELLDGLRGFALLGIMFVNMTWFTGFATRAPEGLPALPTESIDRVVGWFVHFAIDSKFWSLFALLFGVGFAIQLERAERVDRPFRRLFARRMVILFLIGALHATLLWFGDIVSIYAVVGLALLLFHRCGSRSLLLWATVFLLAPIIVGGVWLGIDSMVYAGGAERVDPGHGPLALLGDFGGGTYLESLRANWAFLVDRWYLALYSSRFLGLLGLFLLGAYVVRQGIVHDPDAHRRLLVRTMVLGLLIGVPANAYLVWGGAPLRPPPSLQGWLSAVVHAIGTPALCLAYATAITLAFRSAVARMLLRPLAVAGRLSLTNYLGQSVIGVLLFYGYGLGLWGRFGITWSIAFIVVIFGVQVVFSALWLKAFRFGPVEWMWRCLSYGRMLPLRRGSRERRGEPAEAT